LCAQATPLPSQLAPACTIAAACCCQRARSAAACGCDATAKDETNTQISTIWWFQKSVKNFLTPTKKFSTVFKSAHCEKFTNFLKKVLYKFTVVSLLSFHAFRKTTLFLTVFFFYITALNFGLIRVLPLCHGSQPGMPPHRLSIKRCQLSLRPRRSINTLHRMQMSRNQARLQQFYCGSSLFLLPNC